MTKIPFEDSEILQQAKVTIDGVDYPVTPTQMKAVQHYLSAEKLNALQNNIESSINGEIVVNDKGIAIKYDNGKMICFGKNIQTLNITTAYEGAYFAGIERVVFPVNFKEPPICTVTLQQGSTLIAFNNTEIVKENFGGYVWKVQSKSNVEVSINYIAIGNWK